MKVNSSQKVAAAFGLALAFLALLGWFGYSIPRHFIALTRSRQESSRVLERLAVFLSFIKDAETGQRGYLLTGEGEYLEPYRSAREGATRALDELRRTTARQPGAQIRLSNLEELARRKLAELERTIELRRDDSEVGLAQALDVVRTDEGKRLMDQIRAAVGQWDADEAARRDAAASQAEASAGRLLWISSLVGPTALLLVAGAGSLVMRDLVRRDRAEELLRHYHQNERLLHLLIDGLQEYAIYVLDPQGRIVSWNAGAQRLKGYKAGEIIGRHFSCFYPPEAQAQGRPARALEIARTQGRYAEEGWRVRKDGSRIWASVVMTALYDEQGGLQGFGKVTRDFTERKATEDHINRLNVELEERVELRTAELSESNRSLIQKNREVETFVYSVSHDLRSPLVNLQGFGQELRMVGKELRALLEDPEAPESIRSRGLALLDGEMSEAIQFIQSAVMRLSNIIDSLLRLSRAGRVVYEWQLVELGPIVQRIVESQAAVTAEKGAAIEVGPLPPVWGDPTALEQVFANLIGNAVNYLDPQRPGRISIGSVETGNGAAGHDLAQMRTVFVKDNGLGIPDDLHNRVFHAFQRLHPESSTGEGIGLSLVGRIVERHGGKIWFESGAGVGTTFFVSIPARSTRASSSDIPLTSRR